MPTSSAPLPYVLVVDPSRVMRLVLEQYLGPSFHLVHASEGEEAWRILETQPEIELVLTDLRLPRLGGIELLQRIRQGSLERIRGLPVIVTSVGNDLEERHLAFRSGASDFLVKPLDEVELRARVEVHYRLARTIRELEESRRLLAEQATTDALTGLKNRRALLENGSRFVALARRQRNELALLLLDLDHFKRVNDSLGHAAGDKVLAEIGGILARETRDADLVGRIGGEEFAVFLPGTEPAGAAQLAERIRVAVRAVSLAKSGAALRLSVSIGVAALAADGCDDIAALLETADRRLYRAKEQGRDHVCTSDSDAPA
jgi:diguanylate cyclase (GGDEF)-like protein